MGLKCPHRSSVSQPLSYCTLCFCCITESGSDLSVPGSVVFVYAEQGTRLQREGTCTPGCFRKGNPNLISLLPGVLRETLHSENETSLTEQSINVEACFRRPTRLQERPWPFADRFLHHSESCLTLFMAKLTLRSAGHLRFQVLIHSQPREMP